MFESYRNGGLNIMEIKKGETIYLCYENPYKQTYLVYDENGKFSILTKDQVQDNLGDYIFKKDLEIKAHIDFLISNGFDLNNMDEFLTLILQLK